MDPNHPLDPRFGRYPPPSSGARPAKPFHRRAHSETVLRLPDDFLLDDPDFSIADLDFPSLSDDSTPAPFPKPEPLPEASSAHGSGHFRSLSVDAAFFEGLELDPKEGEKRGKHRHSSSMDGSVSPFEAESAEPFEFAKKAMAADKLAELSLIDPKRAKRILANRQSAARSKERKVRYMSELERKVQTLQTEATTLTAQLAMLQRDTTDLTNENKELKLRLQAMEQQTHLRDALNEALRDEVQRLKIATGQMPTVNGSMFGRELQQPLPQYFPRHQQLHNIGPNQAQQQLHVNRPSSNNQQTNEQAQVDSMEFM